MMNGMNVMIHFVFMNILMLFGFFSIARADSFKKNLVKRSSIWLNPGLLAEPFPANPTYLITKEFPFFTFSYCGGPYIYDAYLLNTCFKAGEDQDAYYKIVCDQNTAAWVNYIDDACNYAANNLTIAQPGCSEMSVYLCGSSSPNSYEAGNYVAQTYYQDSACKNQISNSAYVSGQCYSLLGFAFKMIGLLTYSYKSSGTCDGSYTTTALSDKCTLDPDTQTYTYYSDVSVQSSSSNSNDEELSGGAIVGIVIAVLFSSALIFAAVAVHCKQRLQGHQKLATNESRTTEMMASNFSVNL